MKEFVTQVSYLRPSKDKNKEEFVAIFTYERTELGSQTWSCRIDKVSLKTAAELISTFFNSSYGEKAGTLELNINKKELFIHKSHTQNSPDYYLCDLASQLKIG